MGHDALFVDSSYTGTKQNVAHLISNSRFELMRHDVTSPLYVEVEESYYLTCPDELGLNPNIDYFCRMGTA